MHVPLSPERAYRQRNLAFLTQPALWPNWPYLPVVKRRPGQAEGYGVLVDAMKCWNLPGYSATVFLTTLFMVPALPAEMLALPREVFDTADEVIDAGWSVD